MSLLQWLNKYKLYTPKKTNMWTSILLIGICAISNITGLILSQDTDQSAYSTQNQQFIQAIKLLPHNESEAHSQFKSLQLDSPKDKARQQYILARLEQTNGNLRDALEIYNAIDIENIGALKDRISAHILEIYVIQGNERRIMRMAQEILHNCHYIPTIQLARYELARSYLRQSRVEEAQKILHLLHDNQYQDIFGINATYYLGEVSLNPSQRRKYWLEYMHHNPNGLFGQFVSNSWLNQTTQHSDEQLFLLGQYYYNLQEYRTAQQYFRQITKNPEYQKNSFYYLSDINLNKNTNRNLHFSQKQKYLDNLADNLLTYGTSSDYFKSAINIYIKHSAKQERNILFTKLIKKHPELGDYLLWRQLSWKKSTDKLEQYKNIIDNYPHSQYAGKSATEITKHVIKKNNHLAETAIKDYLKKYNQSIHSDEIYYIYNKIANQNGNLQLSQDLQNHLTNHQIYSYYSLRLRDQNKQLTRINSNANIFDANIQNLTQFNNYPLPINEFLKLHIVERELLKLNLWKEAYSLFPYHAENSFPKMQLWYEAMILNRLAQSINSAEYRLKKKQAQFSQMSDYWNLAYPFLYWNTIKQAAKNNNIDALLLLSLIRQESRFQPHAISSSGALGLCQIMPATGKELFSQVYPRQSFAINKISNPTYNINMGARYLSQLLKQFNGNKYLAIGAYNCGPGAMSRLLRKNPQADLDSFIDNIQYTETKNYIIKVMENYWIYRNLHKQLKE